MEFWEPPATTLERILAARPFTMADFKPEVGVLTRQHLEYVMFIYIADKLTRVEACKEHETEYYLAQQLLRFFLGNQWVEQHVFDREPPATRQYRRGRKFLKSDSLRDIDENVRHQDRLIKLAECLYNLQGILGFKERLAKMETDSLESACSEFECARAMSHPSLKLRFVNPGGTKTTDYDAEITSSSNRTICCEIKSKEDESDLTRKKIENALESARKQLPKSKPGMVWIKIPDLWASQAGAKGIVDQAIRRALRKSNRIVAILAAFQLWEADGDGMLTQFRFTVAANKASRFYGDDIEEVFDQLGSAQNGHWLSLRNLIDSKFSDMVRFVKSASVSETVAPDQHHDLPGPQGLSQ